MPGASAEAAALSTAPPRCLRGREPFIEHREYDGTIGTRLAVCCLYDQNDSISNGSRSRHGLRHAVQAARGLARERRGCRLTAKECRRWTSPACFGKNLSRCRRRAGFSQEELAVRASLHRTEIGLLERGERARRAIDTADQARRRPRRSHPAELLEGIDWSPGSTSRGSFGARVPAESN